jgi:hypothetical protein
MGRVAQRAGGRLAEQGYEQSFDQSAAGLTASAMGHLDLRVSKLDFGNCLHAHTAFKAPRPAQAMT